MTEESGRITRDDPLEAFLAKWQHRLGIVARFVVYAALFSTWGFVAWTFAPSGIGDVPLASLTLNQILSPLFFLALLGGSGTLLVDMLFKPSKEPRARKTWGVLGYLIVLVGIFVIAYYWVLAPST